MKIARLQKRAGGILKTFSKAKKELEKVSIKIDLQMAKNSKKIDTLKDENIAAANLIRSNEASIRAIESITGDF